MATMFQTTTGAAAAAPVARPRLRADNSFGTRFPAAPRREFGGQAAKPAAEK